MAEHDPHADTPAPHRPEGAPAAGQPAVPALRSETLFAGRTELHIEHRGTLYRLRQTALGKLILTK
jgi:hemin uptake protein HemP